MEPTLKKEDVLGFECRFVTFAAAPRGFNQDMHLVKEIVHLKNGGTTTNMRKIFNYKRPYYITKVGKRNHKDKKEWEKIDNLIRYESTETDLFRNVAKSTNNLNVKGSMKKLCRDPYIYGTDILSTALIKRGYQDNHPTLITPFSVCTFDVETDMFDPLKKIIMATVSFGRKVYTVIRKDFMAGQADVEPRLQEMIQKYLGRFMVERKIDWEIKMVDFEHEIVTACFAKTHEWRPDIVAVWNINFDMKKVLEALKRANIDPKDVFSDPCVPEPYRFFHYEEGTNVKRISDGTTKPLKNSEQWHIVYCPSSFYFLDAMCVYRQIRQGGQEETSYALDAILDKVFSDDPEIRKLKFKEADGLEKGEWHQFMQSNYKLEYVVYNVFDCVSMEILDEKTMDLRLTFPSMCGSSDFINWRSQPRRLADELHFFLLKKGYVMASTSDQMTNDLDNDTVGIKGWIVTLPAHLVTENGLRIIKENKHLGTNIRVHVADLDVSASYPNGGAVFNISKDTTHKEISRIIGVPEIIQRMEGINMSGGPTNAVEIACGLYGLPSMHMLLEAFEQENTRITDVDFMNNISHVEPDERYPSQRVLVTMD